jgi:hypothetical protein
VVRREGEEVDHLLRAYIIARDGGCIARFVTSGEWSMFEELADPGPCRTTWGDEISPFDLQYLTIEEVKLYLRAGVKAGYSKETCVAVCPGHHMEGRGPGARWCTKAVVRAVVRLYLPAANERFGKVAT